MSKCKHESRENRYDMMLGMFVERCTKCGKGFGASMPVSWIGKHRMPGDDEIREESIRLNLEGKDEVRGDGEDRP